jgi:hypothetical protein
MPYEHSDHRTERTACIVRYGPETDEFGDITRNGEMRAYFNPDPAKKRPQHETWTTMTRNDGKDSMHCRVCGLRQLEPPWGEDGQTPNYDYCPCCGIEFGYQDTSAVGVARARRKWVESGYLWSDPTAKPAGWGPQEQLRNASAVDDVDSV